MGECCLIAWPCSIVANRGRYTVYGCANRSFGALAGRPRRLLRRFLLRCATGCDGRQLEHDWGNGFDILDDLHFDDDLHDPF
jgi:hypothetical protein